MAEQVHSTIPFAERHRAKINPVDGGTVPSTPDGNGDIYYRDDTQVLAIANAAGTGWNLYTLSAISGLTTLDQLTDVSTAAQNGNHILSIPTGVTNAFSSGFSSGFEVGGSSLYRGRILISGDIPALDAGKFTSGILPQSQQGTGLSTLVNGQILVAGASGALKPLSIGTSGQVATADSAAEPPIRYTTVGAAAFIGARVKNTSSSIAVANNTEHTCAWDSEVFDTDTIHDNVTNNSRLTCKTAGKYRIFASIGKLTAGQTFTAGWYCKIRLNGTTLIAQTDAGWSIATTYALAINDYLEFLILHLNGSSSNYDGTISTFGMQRIAA